MAENTQEFAFEPEFSDCIAQIANGWATFEYYVNDTIWTIAKLDPGTGACLTSQIHSIGGKLNALLALMKLKKFEAKLIAQVDKLVTNSRGPAEARNRVVHDMWLVDKTQPDKMGKFEITAQKKLVFKFREVTLNELRSDLAKIDECRKEALEIRSKIKDALPSLPAAAPWEPYPILESPRPKPLRPKSHEAQTDGSLSPHARGLRHYFAPKPRLLSAHRLPPARPAIRAQPPAPPAIDGQIIRVVAGSGSAVALTRATRARRRRYRPRATPRSGPRGPRL